MQQQKLLFILLTPIIMSFTLPPLKYEKNALEPQMSRNTIEYHYGKHLQTYVDNLNRLIAGSPFEKASLEEIVKASSGPMFNNAAQVLNHSLYFEQLAPNTTVDKSLPVIREIEKSFGSFDEFKKKMNEASISIFGSGWSWLSITPGKMLVIEKLSNADNPIRSGNTPVLAIDVWEHAYYLDYQNRRADHLNALWDIIDWEVVNSRFVDAQ